MIMFHPDKTTKFCKKVVAWCQSTWCGQTSKQTTINFTFSKLSRISKLVWDAYGPGTVVWVSMASKVSTLCLKRWRSRDSNKQKEKRNLRDTRPSKCLWVPQLNQFSQSWPRHPSKSTSLQSCKAMSKTLYSWFSTLRWWSNPLSTSATMSRKCP